MQDSIRPEDPEIQFDLRSRYDWDFQALETFMELTQLLLENSNFLEDLESLYIEAPESVQVMRFDIVWGYIPPDVNWHPRMADLLFPQDGATLVTPGDISQVEQRYSTSWQTVVSLIGSDHPWLKKMDTVVKKWGLLAKWGSGAIVEMMVDWQARKDRASGKIPDSMPMFEMTWNMRRIPHLLPDCPMLYRPLLSPGMSDRQWNEEVELFRKEGLAVLANWRKSLPNTRIWRASYSQMKRHVCWLYRRITPPYLTPVMQAQEEPDIKTRTIENGIAKTAKLLHLKVSPGVRRPKAVRQLDREPRKFKS